MFCAGASLFAPCRAQGGKADLLCLHKRADYIGDWWNVVDWDAAERKYDRGRARPRGGSSSSHGSRLP